MLMWCTVLCCLPQLLLHRPELPLKVIDEVLAAVAGEQVTFRNSRHALKFINDLPGGDCDFRKHVVDVGGIVYVMHVRDLREASLAVLRNNAEWLIDPSDMEPPDGNIHHPLEAKAYTRLRDTFRTVYGHDPHDLLLPLTFFSGTVLLRALSLAAHATSRLPAATCV